MNSFSNQLPVAIVGHNLKFDRFRYVKYMRWPFFDASHPSYHRQAKLPASVVQWEKPEIWRSGKHENERNEKRKVSDDERWMVAVPFEKGHTKKFPLPVAYIFRLCWCRLVATSAAVGAFALSVSVSVSRCWAREIEKDRKASLIIVITSALYTCQYSDILQLLPRFLHSRAQ